MLQIPTTRGECVMQRESHLILFGSVSELVIDSVSHSAPRLWCARMKLVVDAFCGIGNRLGDTCLWSTALLAII